MKYVIVTGGVVSGLGKGITASSIGMLLSSYGLVVTAIKIDPYLNVDAGTISPFEHGEVFVLDDGAETDLDLGNYERFLNVSLHKDNNLTTGKIYQAVIEKERRGEYLGKTVQVVPHITDYIQEHIQRVAQLPVTNGVKNDVCIIELGGTIGDIESSPFIEALAQLKQDLPVEDYCFVHVSLITMVGGEPKTKPTQHSLKTVKSLGIMPDIVCLRCEQTLTAEMQTKLRRTCHLPLETAIISNCNVDTIYRVPDIFRSQGVDKIVLNKLHLAQPHKSSLEGYYGILKCIDNPTLPKVTIAVVGKYTAMKDTYLSLLRALEHASFYLQCRLVVEWIDAELFETTKPVSDLLNFNGVLVPGGFGNRGVEGMILATKFARENHLPFFGICLGMQVMLIELARNTMDWSNANSTEFDETTQFPIVKRSHKLEIQMGGSMRLGLFDYDLIPDTQTSKLYTEFGFGKTISERHRHRYEVSNALFDQMVEKGVVVTAGKSQNETRRIIEVVEWPSVSFGIACQFHSEYVSRNNSPHPLFVGFLRACAANKKT